mgnify:CR=1 FL=1
MGGLRDNPLGWGCTGYDTYAMCDIYRIWCIPGGGGGGGGGTPNYGMDTFWHTLPYSPYLAYLTRDTVSKPHSGWILEDSRARNAGFQEAEVH